MSLSGREGWEARTSLVNPQGPKTLPTATWRLAGKTGLSTRWYIVKNPERLKQEPVGFGSWLCPRESLATAQLSLWLSCLVRQFCQMDLSKHHRVLSSGLSEGNGPGVQASRKN